MVLKWNLNKKDLTDHFVFDTMPLNFGRFNQIVDVGKWYTSCGTDRVFMRNLKLYLETSVWNFVFADDTPEKRDITIEFFEKIKQGEYDVFISQTVLSEIDRADEAKKWQLMQLIKECNPQMLDITQEVVDLSKEYISQRIIPEAKVEDALHVAVASVYEMDAVITWNNRHLANLRKMEKINGINLREGYSKHIELVNPMEVITDEN